VSVTAFGRFSSGNPFTTHGVGRRNGDGYNNDRAFIYDPKNASTDPALAAAMQNLLTNAPSSVRDCLTKQLGVVAGKASCEAPWSTSLSLRVSLVHSFKDSSRSCDGIARHANSAHRYRCARAWFRQSSWLGRAGVD